MAEQDTEERISALEREVAELKQQLQRMVAERQSPDELSSDIVRVRSEITRIGKMVSEFSAREEAHEDYMRARLGIVDFDLGSLDRDIKALQTGQQELREEIHNELQRLREEMGAALQDLHIGQEAIAAGQQQILEFILGKSRKND